MKPDTALLKVKPDGKEYDVVWRDRAGFVDTLVDDDRREGHLSASVAGTNREAMFQCRDLKTGDVAWETMLRWRRQRSEARPKTGKIVNKATASPALAVLRPRFEDHRRRKIHRPRRARDAGPGEVQPEKYEEICGCHTPKSTTRLGRPSPLARLPLSPQRRPRPLPRPRETEVISRLRVATLSKKKFEPRMTRINTEKTMNQSHPDNVFVYHDDVFGVFIQ